MQMQGELTHVFAPWCNNGTWMEVKAKGTDVEHIPGSIVCDPYMGTDFIVHSGGPTHC